ncbi:hypothetical protein H9P43_000160 [Blastocladiella emersonii ATCC 22665]|nr:hypothetical protein H9P43_000160 [Blastocladiella emersonii ATCC 22665]
MRLFVVIGATVPRFLFSRLGIKEPVTPDELMLLGEEWAQWNKAVNNAMLSPQGRAAFMTMVLQYLADMDDVDEMGNPRNGKREYMKVVKRVAEVALTILEGSVSPFM